MRGYEAYKLAQNLPATRIDVILELFTQALGNLERARQALDQQGMAGARPFLVKSQLSVMGLAAGLPAHKDDLAVDFLRLYEFASFQMIQGTSTGIDAAARILRTLFEGFQKVRKEAVELELSNKIRPLNRESLVSVRA